MKLIPILTLSGALALLAAPAFSDPATIESVTGDLRGQSWTFSVTLRHPDTGWDHYADGWEVLDPEGARLGYRELVHPHVNEQPFTRSLSGISISAGTRYVMIRARDNLDGWGGGMVRFDLAN